MGVKAIPYPLPIVRTVRTAVRELRRGDVGAAMEAAAGPKFRRVANAPYIRKDLEARKNAGAKRLLGELEFGSKMERLGKAGKFRNKVTKKYVERDASKATRAAFAGANTKEKLNTLKSTPRKNYTMFARRSSALGRKNANYKQRAVKRATDDPGALNALLRPLRFDPAFQGFNTDALVRAQLKRLNVPKDVKVVLPNDREIAALLTREGSASESGRMRRVPRVLQQLHRRARTRSLKAAYERELQSIQQPLSQKINAVKRLFSKLPAPPQHLKNSLVVAMMERNASRRTGLNGGVNGGVIFVKGKDGTFTRKNLPKDGRNVFGPNQVPHGAFLVSEDGKLTHITNQGAPVSSV